MAGSSPKKRSAASRVFAGVAVVAILLAVALTAAWFYLARELDRRVTETIEAAAGDGVAIGCAGQDVFGYPFRIGLACEAVTLDAPEPGVRASAGSLRSAAQVYDPRHIVMELGSPMSLQAPDLPPLDLSWALTQASARFAGDGLERLSIAVDEPVIALAGAAAGAPPLARARHFEVHSRRNGADLDLALNDAGLVVTPPGLGELPPFDIGLDMSVAGAAPWLTDGLPGGRLETALRGREGTVRRMRIVLPAGGAAEASGPFSVSAEGLISGDFSLALEDPDAIAGLVGQLVPGMGGIAATIAGGLAFAGRQEDGRTVVDVQVREGRAQLGFVPLGRIPAI